MDYTKYFKQLAAETERTNEQLEEIRLQLQTIIELLMIATEQGEK